MDVLNSRQKLSAFTARQGRTYPGYPYPDSVSQTFYGEYVSEFESLTGWRGPRLRNQLHSCTHTKFKSTPIISRQLHRPYSGSIAQEYISGLIPVAFGPGPDNGWAYYVSCNPTYALTGADSRELIKDMSGDLKPIVSVPNMILELPQTLSLWHDLRKPLMKALSLSHQSKSARWKSGANSLLSQQFGLLPLIGDLTSLLTSTKSVHSEVARLKALPIGWSSTKKKLSPRNASVNWNITGRGIAGTARIQETSQRVSAYVSYKHRLSKVLPDTPELTSQVSRALYGFENPVGVLWEATPFSFVSDWFNPIGDYLTSLDKSSFADSMQTKDVCTCVSVEAQCSIIGSFADVPTPFATVRVSNFTRKLGYPSNATIWDELSLPNVKQSILGAALAVQKWA